MDGTETLINARGMISEYGLLNFQRMQMENILSNTKANSDVALQNKMVKK